MPELPEVQTIVSDLNKRITRRRIAGFWTDTPKIIKKPKAEQLKSKINGLYFISVLRRGKNILFYLSKDKKAKRGEFLMLAHQKMTGHFMVGDWLVKKIAGKWSILNKKKGPLDDPRNQFIRAIFYLDDGKMLALSDVRKFSKIVFGKREEVENLPDLKNLGPDALSADFSAKYLFTITQKRNVPIKSIIMDQKNVAGVGNIYADESLFKSGLNPFKKSNQITRKQIEKLVLAIKQILKKAVGLRGTSIIDFRDTFGKKGSYDKVRLVYGREKLPCPKCGRPILRKKLNQRSSHFCSFCQK